jgi:hypothetical protein
LASLEDIYEVKAPLKIPRVKRTSGCMLLLKKPRALGQFLKLELGPQK